MIFSPSPWPGPAAPTGHHQPLRRNWRMKEVLKYSRRFHICDTVTTPEVRIRRVFVWRLSESIGVEAMAYMGEWLGTPEMLWECSGIVPRCVWSLELRLVRRWNEQESHYSVQCSQRARPARLRWSLAWPVKILGDLAWPKPAGLRRTEPGRPGLAYRPCRLCVGWQPVWPRPAWPIWPIWPRPAWPTWPTIIQLIMLLLLIEPRNNTK